jgi:hypothetical protein
LNDNAKFAVCNKEIFFCGEFTNGSTVSAASLISPADGYVYSYAETKFLAFWRWTSDGSQLISPPEIYSQLGRFSCDIDSSTGAVTTAVYATDNDGNDQHCIGYGRVAVVAFCARSATPGAASLANAFTEIDGNAFIPGSTLRASTVLALKKNIDEAILCPEFFGPTTYADGATVPLPVSPVDGYTYARDEITVIWAWSDLDPGSTPHDRIPVFYGSVSPTTGAVSLACWRLSDHYVDDNNTICRIRTIVMARRQHVITPAASGNALPPGDVGTDTIPSNINPYAIAFDMGGGRTDPMGTGESFLMHGISANLAGVKLDSGLPGSVAGCRVAPTGDYTLTIKINGSALGSVLYPAGNTTGIFTFGGPVTVVPGDRIEFVGGTADATISGLFWTVVGTRISS